MALPTRVVARSLIQNDNMHPDALEKSPPALRVQRRASTASVPSHDDPDSPQDTDLAKRRPLPTPPSSAHFGTVPSSPPPPYSWSLPDQEQVPTPSTTCMEPDAPVIMDPPPNEQGTLARAPYDTFLCHSPPANTWIAVETAQSEYTLLVRLPGFSRDGITIATKRRRILHVVADSWEPEGGHFERRVSFGYDAELAQVRAEFDGEMLRIVVPRRVSVATTS